MLAERSVTIRSKAANSADGLVFAIDTLTAMEDGRTYLSRGSFFLRC
jgi:hypothetical protein